MLLSIYGTINAQTGSIKVNVMDSSDLIILRHLLIEKNISITAKLMNVSQPAITMRLGKLRTMFKDDILVREGNKMRLTPKAQDMINPIVRMTDEMLSLMPQYDFDPYKTPTSLTIQMTEILLETCGKILIERFLRYNAQHKININTLLHTAIQEPTHYLQNTDVVIGAASQIKGFSDEVYSHENIVLLHDSYFDEQKKIITYEEYLQLPHIILSHDLSNYSLLSKLGHPEPRNICLEVNNLKTAIELLQHQYVMSTSTIIARIFNKKYLPLPFELPEMPFKLSYPEHLKHDKKNCWIRHVCNTVMQDLLKTHS